MHKQNERGRSKVYLLIDCNWMKIDVICSTDCDENTTKLPKKRKVYNNIEAECKKENC